MDKDVRAKSLHDLICHMLRGGHVNKLNHDDLRDYIYSAGVALHNLPSAVLTGADISVFELNQINRLDPSAKPGEWGYWCKKIADDFHQELPSSPDPKYRNFLFSDCHI